MSWAWVTSLFSGDKIGDTVVDLIRDKTGLNELNDKERLEHERERIRLLTEYQTATKHQSNTRRFIAVGVTALMFLFVVVWLVSQGVGTLAEWQPGVYFAARVKLFYEDILLMPTTLVLGFYFGVQAVNSLRTPSHQGSKHG
jgi:hypothetical protein